MNQLAAKPKPAVRLVVRRKPAVDRETEIIAAAAQFFAAEGFGGTTRELARKLGVTQAIRFRPGP